MAAPRSSGDPYLAPGESNQLKRAGSLADSAVLRRKGRLKEQDPFIEFIVDLFKTHETEEALAKAERWLADALALPVAKRRFANIHRQVPKLGYFFHPPALSKALAEYDEFLRPDEAQVRPTQLRGGATHHKHRAGARQRQGCEAGDV